MPKTVLAVDYYQGILNIYKDIFEGYPAYNLITTDDPLKAIETSKGQSIDLLITDSNLKSPEMKVGDLIKKVSQTSSQTKFLLCTDHEEIDLAGILNTLKGDGIDVEYFYKYSLSTRKLIEKVKSMIGE